MPLLQAPALRRNRPAGPRCRGGVSSVLRLAQPASSYGLGPWAVRAAAAGAASFAAASALDARAVARLPSIITLLLPSRDLAPR